MPPPKLHAISLVAALCPCIVVSQQDTTDMLPNVKMIYDLVASQKTSWWSRFKLHVMMGMTALLVTWIPTSWLVKMTASISNPQLPSPDQAVCRNDEATSMGLVSSMKVAMQQGSRPAIQEACALFRKVAPCWLSSLQTFYQDKNKEKKDLYDDDDDDVAFTRVFPNICIHHGKLDANVPLSNAEYMFKHIFFSSTGHVTKQQQNDDDQSNSNDNSNNRIGGGGGVVKLVVYEDLGHVSLVTTKTDEIARFAVLSS